MAAVTTVYRFATSTDPTTIESRLSSANWPVQVRVNFMMRFKFYREWRADRHMRGDVEKSPFISVLEDPAKLATSPDPWARTIATGSPGHPLAQRAPDIGTFSVPQPRLIYPKPHNLLSTIETERAFWGNSLAGFLIEWNQNPY